MDHRVQGDFDAGFLGDRDHLLHEGDVVVEHLGFSVFAVFRFFDMSVAGDNFACQRPLQVKSGHLDAAAPDRHRRAPDEIGHPVNAQNRDAGFAQIANERLIVGGLLGAARTIQHGVNVEVARHVLDRFQLQVVVVDPLLEAFEIVDLPIALVFGQVNIFGDEVYALADHVKLYAADAQLFGEGQILMRRR